MKNPTVDYEPILEMLEQGFGPAVIIEKLGLSISKRQIQKIAAKHGVNRSPRRSGGRLESDGLGSGPFQQIVFHGMTEIRGLDPHTCMQCGATSKKRMDIHHTKYDGATLYDLEFVCRSCNLAPYNVGLE